jgi:hypothetical protein
MLFGMFRDPPTQGALNSARYIGRMWHLCDATRTVSGRRKKVHQIGQTPPLMPITNHYDRCNFSPLAPARGSAAGSVGPAFGLPYTRDFRPTRRAPHRQNALAAFGTTGPEDCRAARAIAEAGRGGGTSVSGSAGSSGTERARTITRLESTFRSALPGHRSSWRIFQTAAARPEL